MWIGNITWYILIPRSMCGCVQNICVYEFKIIIVVQKLQNLTYFILNYVMDVAILWIMYTLTLLKSFEFFMIGLWTQNILPLKFFNFWIKFRYYYNYYILILWSKVDLYIANNSIIHLYMTNGLLWNLWV
jgi:hypothetical protein